MLKFVGYEELKHISRLAEKIWKECYSSILSKEQIEYMISEYQSEEAMIFHMKEKDYEYAYIVENNEIIGYTALCPRKDRLFVSKLYLLKEYRSKGYGTKALTDIESYAKDKKINKICLTVNKLNNKAIEAYERNGFTKIHSICTDIGDGFVMDDYVMEKSI